MNGSSLRTKLGWAGMDSTHRLFELSLSLLVGLLVGSLLVFSGGLSSRWQGLLILVFIAVPFVLLIRDVKKIVLAGIVIGLILNLYVSLIISPYSRSREAVAFGLYTIVALTELRASLILAMVVIGYVYWLIQPRDSTRVPFRFFSSTSIPALGFIAFSVLSVYQSQDQQLSLFQIVQLFELFFIYLYLANHLQTAQNFEFFITVLMWGLLAEHIFMIWQMISGMTFSIGGIDAMLWENPRRVAGTIDSPQVVGGITSAYLAIACAMLWVFPKRTQKVFAAICFGVGCIALVGTGSRSSWGGFAVAMLVFVLMSLWRGWMRRGTVVLLFITVLVIGALFYQPILGRLTEDDGGSADSRPKMFTLAWNVIEANPWLGVGANNYALVAPNYYTPEVGNLGYIIDSVVHNRYLLTWAETGLGGLLLFISFLAAPLIVAWRHIRWSDRHRALLALGLGCALISMYIQMLAEHFTPRPSMFFLWLLVALVASLRNLKSIWVAPASSGRV
jgi:O-antigen ligase